MARSENTRIAGNESGRPEWPRPFYQQRPKFCVFLRNVLKLKLSRIILTVLRSFGMIFKKDMENLKDVCLSLCSESVWNDTYLLNLVIF